MISRFTDILMLFNILVVGIFLWWALEPVKLSTHEVHPFPVLNENHEVTRGEDLRIQIEFTKYRDYEATTFRNIVCDNGDFVTLSPLHSAAPLGTHSTIAEIEIPSKTSLGKCHVSYRIVYDINPLKEIERDLRTEDFLVTP